MPTYLARASAKQVEANRRNAQRSTGPVTDAGRAKSSQNSLRHGLCARVVPGVNPALADEDPAEYARFADAMRRDLRPCGEVEEVLADRAAQLAWRLRRVPGAEAEAADRMIAARREAHEREEFGRKKTAFVGPGMGALLAETCLGKEAGVFERLQIYEQRLERQFHGCLQQLRLLRKMKQEQGENSEYDHRSAELGIEMQVGRGQGAVGGAEEPPPMGARHDEAQSGAQPRGPGGLPVLPSPLSFVFENEETKEEGDESTGGTHGIQGARRTTARDDARDARDAVNPTLPSFGETAGERTKPILLQGSAREEFARRSGAVER